MRREGCCRLRRSYPEQHERIKDLIAKEQTGARTLAEKAVLDPTEQLGRLVVLMKMSRITAWMRPPAEGPTTPITVGASLPSHHSFSDPLWIVSEALERFPLPYSIFSIYL